MQCLGMPREKAHGKAVFYSLRTSFTGRHMPGMPKENAFRQA